MLKYIYKTPFGGVEVTLNWLIFVVIAYFIGSIPFGYLIGKYFYGVDVRTKGSGNIGATNVYRVLGIKAGGLTAILDILKGLIPVIVVRCLFSDPWIWAFVGVAAVFGHVFSIYLRFGGGKGIATSFGVGLVLCPGCVLFAIGVWIFVASLTNYISLSSITAFLFGTICSIFFAPRYVTMAFFLMFLLITIAHRENIYRLLRGTERKTPMPWQRKRSSQ